VNWLAHLLLSESSAEFRMGNLLADLVRPPFPAAFSADILRGIACHRRIDAFTDQHALVRRSKQRVSEPFRRFSGILVDMFYDHLLAKEWDSHAEIPLEQFAQEFYASIDKLSPQIPLAARGLLDRMHEEDWLGSYGELAGLRRALERLGRRLKRPLDLGLAVADLEEHYPSFQADFRVFFPELRAHVESVAGRSE
jgi:acyl carrier protein phosphodiesterase